MYCVLRRKTDAMLGSGVLSVTPESRSLQMKGGSRVSPCAHSPEVGAFRELPFQDPLEQQNGDKGLSSHWVGGE